MANAVVRTDNMSGTTLGKNLVTLRYTSEIQNGSILGVGDLIAGERYVREGLVPADGARLALVASEEVMGASNAGTDFISEFINGADELIRGYVLVNGDEFSVTKVGVTGGDAVAVGNVAFVPAGSTKISVGSTASGIEFGKVIAIEGDFVVFEVAFPVA